MAESGVRFTAQSGGDPERVLVDFLYQWKPTPEQMKAAADAQIVRIKERTAAGKDVYGNTFGPYSKEYAKTRQRKGLQVSPPNLRVTGKMLDSMQSEVRSETEFAITLTDSTVREYGAANQYGNNGRARRFFDTSKAELEQMALDLRGGK